jgi:hypothetical protein
MIARILWAGLFLTVCLAGGCVERRFVITSDPPGAIIYDENNLPIGATPVDKPFTYYGKYRFTLVKDGYQTTVVEEKASPPWYDFFPVDFVSENLIPFTFRDVRRVNAPMQPLQILPPEPVLKSAIDLRDYGRTIGAPLSATGVPLLPAGVGPP